MSHRLNPGQRLVHGKSLQSRNGRYHLKMQNDGNLVLYGPGGVPTWDSGTTGARKCVVVMQKDGNLVIIAEGNRPVWNSGTNGQPECVLYLQNDGNLVIIAKGNRPVWHTSTGLSNMRVEISHNGSPSQNNGKLLKNASNQSITISSGSLAIEVPPNGEGGIIPINQSQPVRGQITAISGSKLIQLSKFVFSGDSDLTNAGSNERGKHLEIRSSGDLVEVDG